MDEKVTYRQQVNFCGKPRCRKCRDGIGHGPYWYAYHLTDDGRTVRTYIGKHLPPGVSINADGSPVPVLSAQAAAKSRDNLYSEIDTLDRLLAADPTNERAVQRLMIALAQSKRRGEALRAYLRFATVLQSASRRVPLSETREMYEAVQRGDDLSDYARAISTSPAREDSIDDSPSTVNSIPDAARAPSDTHTSFVGTEFIASSSSAAADAPPAFDTRIGRSNQSKLVGRDHERKILWQMLESAEQAARGPGLAPAVSRNVGDAGKKRSALVAPLALEKARSQCMMLMGESGIGKTRLAEETAREAKRRGWAVIWSHAYAQESSIPYRLWSEVLQRVIAQGLWKSEQVFATPEATQRYAPLSALLPELQEDLTRGGEGGGQGGSGYNSNPLSPEQEQVYLREAVYELLATISADVPLLIVLDDVQWADGSSCEMLGYLARRLPGQAIVLLGTCRETELSNNTVLRSLLAHMQREHAVEYLHVLPLTDAQIGALVAHLPALFVRHIQSQAAGNPFFAEELAHSLPLASERARVEAVDTSSSLPTTIAAALNQRMNRLSAPCQQLLSKAAVLGGSFDFSLICAMESDEVDEDAVLDLLDEALRADVLTEEGTGTRVTYRFWHPLLASHLYNALSATRRSRMHRRAAEVLQQMLTVPSAREEGGQAAAITEHLVKGGAEAGHILRYAELAANYAYALSAYPEAERQYRVAVQFMEASDPRHGRPASQPLPDETRQRLAYLLERLAECARIQGKFQEARQLFERVLEVRNYRENLAEAPDPPLEAQIQALLWSEIGWTWRFTGDNGRAWECSARGEQVLRAAGITTGPAAARLRVQQSSLYWQEGQYEEGLRCANEALALFEAAPMESAPAGDTTYLTRIKRTLLGDPVDLGRTHALVGALANATGQRDEALRHLNTALTLYERHDRQREIAHVCCNIGYVYLKKADLARAHSFLQRSLSLAERIGDVPLVAVVLHDFAELAAAKGDDLDEAESLYHRSLALAEQIHDREYLSQWNADLALLLLRRGKFDEVGIRAKRALTIARQMRTSPSLGHALVVLGTLRIAQYRQDNNPLSLKRARRLLERALSLAGLEMETRAQGEAALREIATLL